MVAAGLVSPRPRSREAVQRVLFLPEGTWDDPLNFSGVTLGLGRALEVACRRRKLEFQIVDSRFVINTEELLACLGSDAERRWGIGRLTAEQRAHPLTQRFLSSVRQGEAPNLNALSEYALAVRSLVSAELHALGRPGDVVLCVNPLNPGVETDLPTFLHMDTLLASFYFDPAFGVMRRADARLQAFLIEQERLSLVSAERVWIWSEACAEELRVRYPELASSTGVIRAAANLSEIPEFVAREFELPLRVLFIGRNLAFKGRRVIEALADDLPSELQLTIVTEERFHPAEAAPGVRYLPVVGKERVCDLLRAHDVFLFPTEFDPFGLVLCEAMAFAMPIVASAVRAVPEILGTDGGQLVRPASAEAFRERLVQLAHAPERLKALSRANHSRARATFTWGSVANDLLDGMTTAAPEAPRVTPIEIAELGLPANVAR